MSKVCVVYWSQSGNTQAMAEAVGNSDAERILIPFQNCGSRIIGITNTNTGKLIEEAVNYLFEEVIHEQL